MVEVFIPNTKHVPKAAPLPAVSTRGQSHRGSQLQCSPRLWPRRRVALHPPTLREHPGNKAVGNTQQFRKPCVGIRPLSGFNQTSWSCPSKHLVSLKEMDTQSMTCSGSWHRVVRSQGEAMVSSGLGGP